MPAAEQGEAECHDRAAKECVLGRNHEVVTGQGGDATDATDDGGCNGQHDDCRQGDLPEPGDRRQEAQ